MSAFTPTFTSALTEQSAAEVQDHLILLLNNALEQLEGDPRQRVEDLLERVERARLGLSISPEELERDVARAMGDLPLGVRRSLRELGFSEQPPNSISTSTPAAITAPALTLAQPLRSASQIQPQLQTQTQSQAQRMRASQAQVGTFVSGVRILEARHDADIKRYRIVVIQAGESLNGRYYPPHVLEEAVPLFEGKSVHAFRYEGGELNHLPDEVREHAPYGALGNKTGWLENCAYDGDAGHIECDWCLLNTQSNSWLSEMADKALKLGKQLFGFSIDGDGDSVVRKVRNRVVEWVEKIRDIYSLDAVSDPAAGGRVLAKVMTEAVGDPSSRLRAMERLYSQNATHSKLSSHPDDGRTGFKSVNQDGDKDEVNTVTEAKRTNVKTSNRNGMGAGVLRRCRKLLERVDHPTARSVRRTLRTAESLDREQARVTLNVSDLVKRLAEINDPPIGVRKAINELQQAALHEQDAGVDTAANANADAAQSMPDSSELVDKLLELLEGEEAEGARSVAATLKKAKELAASGQSVELDLQDLIEHLESVEEPSESVQQALSLLQKELEKQGKGKNKGEYGQPQYGQPQYAAPPPQQQESRLRKREQRQESTMNAQIAQLQSQLQEKDRQISQLRRDFELREHRERLQRILAESKLTEELQNEIRDEYWNSPATEREIKQAVEKARKIEQRVYESKRPRWSTLQESQSQDEKYSALAELFGPPAKTKAGT